MQAIERSYCKTIGLAIDELFGIMVRATIAEEDRAMSEKRKKYLVDAKAFVKVWQQASSLAEVAAKLNMPEPICSARASMYRAAGVELRRMPRAPSSRKLDVAGLNQLIADLKAEKEASDGKGRGRKKS
jgi:hypothetical protein